jgi:predicted enzyme related to lactoylglutathione lyase
MKEVEKHPHGTFCWPELGTTNPVAAKSYYGSVFGWRAQDMPMPGMVYTMLQLEGRDVAGLYGLTPEETSQGKAPAWLCYVSVDNADAVANKVKELGGKAIMGPVDVPEAGRAAVFQDPQGAVFGIWQPGKHIGARIVNEPGSLVWAELATTDEKAANEFYTKLFPWNPEIMDMKTMKYTIFKSAAQPGAGMYQITSDMKGMPPSWTVYFAVADCDQTAATAKAKGANVLREPTDIPNVGRFAFLTDPQGAMFAIIKPKPM